MRRDYKPNGSSPSFVVHMYIFFFWPKKISIVEFRIDHRENWNSSISLVLLEKKNSIIAGVHYRVIGIWKVQFNV